MRVGVPREIKDHEDRVGLVPSSVAELVHHGHEVLIERGAGLGAGLGDEQYVAAGARIAADAAEVFAASELIVKVKEPLATERKRLRAGQVLFTYLHLAPDPEQTHDLLEERRDRHRLRDGDLADRHPAAADADVGDRRPARAAGRRALSRAHLGRTRRAAGRRAGRAAGRGRGAGRRRVGHACRHHRARHGRHGVRGRPLGRGAAPAGGADARLAHHLLHARCAEPHPAPRRPGDRRRAGAGRRRAQARHPRDGGVDEARQRDRRHRHRPGRLLRDLAADLAFRIRPMSRKA